MKLTLLAIGAVTGTAVCLNACPGLTDCAMPVAEINLKLIAYFVEMLLQSVYQ